MGDREEMLLSLGYFFSSLEMATRYKGQDQKAERMFAAADFCLPKPLRGEACVRPQDRRPPAGRFTVVVVNEGHRRHL